MNIGKITCRVGLSGLLLSLGLLTGCGGANGDEVAVAETRTDGSKLTSEDEQAVEFIQAELAKIWVKVPDGWTTQLLQYNVLGEVMPDRVPVVLYKQYRTLAFSVSPTPLTETMKLNGTDYRCGVTFKDSPVRYFQTQATYDGPAGWGPWRDEMLSFRGIAVERRNGKWLTSDDDLFGGSIKPNPDEVAAAGSNQL